MTTKEEIILTKYDLLFESRLSKVESSLDHLDKTVTEMKTQMKSDFRWLFSVIILLGGMMSKGFHWF